MINLDRYTAVSAQHESSTTGSKYAFIPTTQVIDVLGREGWVPSKVSEARTLKAARKGFQKHMIRFRQADSPAVALAVGGLVPEIVLTNAHDGCASFQLMAGIFRLVCSNGLVVADSMFATHKIKHIGFTENKVLSALQDVTESTPRVMSRVEEFQGVRLDEKERMAYAEAALLVRADGDEAALPEGRDKDYTLTRLLAPRRSDDAAPTLWNVFNTVQEKFLKGARFMSTGPWAARKTREVKSVDKNIALNKALWALTEKMAELKGVA